MKKDSHFLDALRGTRVIRPPKHAIATFGTTTLRYVLLSMVPDSPNHCRLREGEVTAQRPKILTPEFWKDRLEGFGDDAQELYEEFEKQHGQALKGLEYRFHNNLTTTSLEHAPLLEVADRTQKILDSQDAPRTALLEGPDASWSLCVLKFIVDISLRSFPGNFQELADRGFFNPEKKQETRERFEIEKLFQKTQADRSQKGQLAAMLKQSGRFAEYEDRFFALVRS